MRIAFAVNNIKTEYTDYTTTHLALTATNQGHDVFYVNVGDFALSPDDRPYAHGVAAPKKHHRSTAVFLQELHKISATEKIFTDELDVLVLRNDPAQDATARPWACRAAIEFGRLAMQQGVLVLNDPNGLDRAFTKLYLKSLPQWVYPRTLITRNKEDIKSFVKDQGGYAILKPLMGSGGRGVFVVRPQDEPNLNQMVEAIVRDGYIIAQEFLPDGIKGDTRLFVMNAEPLRCKGHIAAIHRQRAEGDLDIRSNMSAGAIAVKAEVTDQMIALCDAVKPFLVQNGIFLAGLDIVADKILEINLMSPGGMDSASKLEGVNFFTEVINAIENKVNYLNQNPGNPDNIKLATLNSKKGPECSSPVGRIPQNEDNSPIKGGK
ncbi:MAG: glutathione synthase [Gammaproteobacteria bacterium]